MAAIQLNGITKVFWIKGKEVPVVSDLSLSIEKGKVFGFLGPNGAGKTTTIKMIVGLSRPDSGSISVLGKDPGSMESKMRTGFMPEHPSFYMYLTARELLYMIADIFGIPRKDQKERAEALMKKVDLSEVTDDTVRKYSKGMLQRLGVAQALMNDPDVIFLDEPLDGLDPLGRSEIKKLLLDLKKEGKTIFFNSHILSDVEDICDEVGIIDKGVLVARGTVAAVKGSFPSLEDAFVSIIEKNRKTHAEK
jgi:ABC-2 type transport system ATP-binding protein